MSEAIIDSQSALLQQTNTNSVGTVLKSAREARGFSVADVSDRLHNSPRQIHALESDQFEMLPEPMITRGFIRNYARLLELDAEPLLQAFRIQMPLANASPSINLPSANIIMSDHEPSHWMRYSLLGLFVLLSLWFIYTGFIAKPTLQKPAAVIANAEISANPDMTFSAPAPVSEKPVAAETPVNVEPTQPRAESVVANAVKADPVVSSQTPPGVGAVNPGMVDNVPLPKPTIANAVPVVVNPTLVQLKFVTSEKSWINVLDGQNKPLFNKTKPAASEDQIEGQPPFKLTLGNARATQVYLNGKLVDLQPYIKGNVARFTLP